MAPPTRIITWNTIHAINTQSGTWLGVGGPKVELRSLVKIERPKAQFITDGGVFIDE